MIDRLDAGFPQTLLPAVLNAVSDRPAPHARLMVFLMPALLLSMALWAGAMTRSHAPDPALSSVYSSVHTFAPTLDARA